MCGRYASSRRPEDLVEEFEVVDSRVQQPLEPDYNVAPTKEVYAVVERPPVARTADEPPQRQLRALRWGLVPSWAKDPSIGNRMINARMETVAEKPAFRRAFAVRRCLLPADGYFEWYPTEQKTKAGKPLKQPFFIRPAGRRRPGDGRPLRDLARPDPRRGRPRAVPLDLHGAHHRGRGRGRPHPRPDAADGRAGAVGRLARPDVAVEGRPARAAGARRPGPARGLPGLDAGQQRPQQRPRAGRAAAARGRAHSEPVRRPRHESRFDDPARRRRRTSRPRPPADRHPAAQPRRRRRASSARDLAALATAPAPAGRHRRLLRAALAGRRPQDRHRRRRPSTPACARPPAALAVRGRRWSSAAGRPGPARRPAAPAASALSGCLALSFPLHPPGQPEKSRLDELRRRRRARRWWSRASATRSGRPEEFPRPTTDLAVDPGADHGFKVPKRGPDQPRTTRWRSWSRRRWSGWSARSSGNQPAAGEPCCAGPRARPARTTSTAPEAGLVWDDDD